MTKFEYRVLVADWTATESAPKIEQMLNQAGRNGWELVGSSRDQYPTDMLKNDQLLLILKRLVR